MDTMRGFQHHSRHILGDQLTVHRQNRCGSVGFDVAHCQQHHRTNMQPPLPLSLGSTCGCAQRVHRRGVGQAADGEDLEEASQYKRVLYSGHAAEQGDLEGQTRRGAADIEGSGGRKKERDGRLHSRATLPGSPMTGTSIGISILVLGSFQASSLKQGRGAQRTQQRETPPPSQFAS